MGDKGVSRVWSTYMQDRLDKSHSAKSSRVTKKENFLTVRQSIKLNLLSQCGYDRGLKDKC